MSTLGLTLVDARLSHSYAFVSHSLEIRFGWQTADVKNFLDSAVLLLLEMIERRNNLALKMPGQFPSKEAHDILGTKTQCAVAE